MLSPRHPRLRIFVAWLAAVLTATAAGSIAQTQFNLAALTALGAEIGFALRGRATLHDLLGFAPVWALIVAVGLLLALPIACWLGRRWPAWRAALCTLAGAAAIFAALWLMQLATGLNVVAAARSNAGVVTLALTGALGGWVFARASRLPTAVDPA